MIRPLVTAAAAAGAMAWAVRGRSSQVFGPSVWRGDPSGKSIALTFDDGPSGATAAILELLRAYDVPATFFQCGANVLRHPDLAAAVASHGHEIGNHSFSHPNFALHAPSFIRDEFERAQDTISSVTGQTPTLLRVPFGVRWFGVSEAQRRLGLTGVMWSIIGLDWKLPAEGIARRVLARVRGGDIICLHDGRGTLENPDAQATIEAARRIVPELLRRGYHLETVTQLLCPLKPAPTI